MFIAEAMFLAASASPALMTTAVKVWAPLAQP